MSLEPVAPAAPPSEGSALRVELLTLSRRLDALEPVSEALDRLKGDLASLRAALLGRAEDRGGIALALDRFRSDVTDVKAEISTLRANTLLEQEHLGQRILALETQVSEMEVALKDRLERVEHIGARFEVLYDSRPLRLLRRLFVRAPRGHS